MRWAAGLLATVLVAGCASEATPAPAAPEEAVVPQESRTFSLPDPCELVEDPDPELLVGGTLAVTNRVNNEYSVICEKETEFGEGGKSMLTVRVVFIPGTVAYENLVKEVEKGHCDRLPGIEEIACTRLEKITNSLRVGRGSYHADVIFRFVGAEEKDLRRFAEAAAVRVSRALG